MVLLNHGLFTFADDARTAYENHVELVERALARLVAAERGDPPPGLGGDEALDADAEALDVGAFGAGDASAFGSGSGAAVVGAEDSTGVEVDDPGTLGAIAGLRRDISRAAGAPMVLRAATGEDARPLRARDPTSPRVTQVGPATPDHVLRTKRIPLRRPRRRRLRRATTRPTSSRNRGRLGDRAVVPVDPRPGWCSTPSSACWSPAAGWPTPQPPPRSTTTPPG